MPSEFYCKAVGVSFARGYPDTLIGLVDAWQSAELAALQRDDDSRAEPLRAILRRNPQNEHDENAIEVHVPAALTPDDCHVGHLPAALAARLAPLLDAGEEWAAEVEDVLVHPDHPDRPGISIHVHRVRVDA